MQVDIVTSTTDLYKLALTYLAVEAKYNRDVNETLGSETETRPRRLTFSPRRDRDLPTLCRDRDETETETLRGRDRDVFRDVGTLGYLK